MKASVAKTSPHARKRIVAKPRIAAPRKTQEKTYNHAVFSKSGEFIRFVKKPASRHPLANVPPADFDKIIKIAKDVGGFDIKIPPRR